MGIAWSAASSVLAAWFAAPVRKHHRLTHHIQQWENLSSAQKMQEMAAMPRVCHQCGNRGVGDGGTVESFSPDVSVGYTKMICKGCALEQLVCIRW